MCWYFRKRSFSISGEFRALYHDVARARLTNSNSTEEIRNIGSIAFNGFKLTQKKERMSRGNRFLLKAIFRNLLKNAIKYGGKGCRIAIGCRERQGSLIINVYNSGMPIPKECRNRLFNKFDRLSSKQTGDSDGMGFGLYLVKQIIKKHGGDIWYEAKQNGSNF